MIPLVVVLPINAQGQGCFPLEPRVISSEGKLNVLFAGQSEFLAALDRPDAQILERIVKREFVPPSARAAFRAVVRTPGLGDMAPAILCAAFDHVVFNSGCSNRNRNSMRARSSGCSRAHFPNAPIKFGLRLLRYRPLRCQNFAFGFMGILFVCCSQGSESLQPVHWQAFSHILQCVQTKLPPAP